MAAVEDRASSEVVVDDALVAEGTPNTSGKRRNGRVRQKLAIETSLARNIHKCNQQADSPLWKLLPLEIRYMIWEFATAQYEDMSRAFPEHDNMYRPDHRAPLQSCTVILLTCRRAWLEASSLPMRQAVHLFWFRVGIYNMEHYKATGRQWADFGSRLTPLNLTNVRSVHFMFPLHLMDYLFGNGISFHQIMKRLKPKTLKITNRHCDWSYGNWEYREDSNSGCERRTVRNIALVLDACSIHVEKFQLALEIYDCKDRSKVPTIFLDSLRRLEKRVGIFKGLNTETYYETNFRVVDEPCVSKWSCRRSPYSPREECHLLAPNYDIQVHELEWVHVHTAIDPSIGGRFGVPDDPAPKNPFLPRQVRRKPRVRVCNNDLDSWSRQQDLVRRHSQKLSEALAARWRKEFNEMREKAEVATELERICVSRSLLYIKD